MLKIKQFAFNPFGVSTFVVFDTETLYAIIIDPGMVSDRERDFLDSFIADNKLKVRQIVNTHMHLDHCFGDNYVRDKYGVKVSANELDGPLGHNIARQAAAFGIVQDIDDSVEIDVKLKEGDYIPVGDYKFEVLHVPGHSPGSIVLYCPEASVAIVGDVLFRGAIGRTDLEGGNHAQLIQGIKTKLATLPGNTMILPGHGPATTIAEELSSNPYLR